MTTMQQFLASATKKQSELLLTALNNLPEEKRNWVPTEASRHALDQVAECAMLNGSTASLLVGNEFPKDFDFAVYLQQKVDLSKDYSRTVELLQRNTEVLCGAIANLSDNDLLTAVQMPWGSMTLQDLAAYPLWNMTYHEGQITYIHLMLGQASP